jgi:prepilin-type N-terminal cleavage/methylation domain-containing protein
MIRNKKRGFTLIEILIAILILGIVLSTVYASYTGTFRIIRTSEYDSEIYDMGRMTMERMMKDFGSITPYREKFELTARRNDQGREGFMSVSFTAAVNLALGDRELSPGVSTVAYFISEDREKDGLVLLRADERRRAKNPGNGPGPGPGFILCDRVHSCNLKFFDATGKGHDVWNSATESDAQQKDTAPTAVAIELKLVNPADPAHPYTFMTRVFLPVTRVERE